jgi:hypothetical protein
VRPTAHLLDPEMPTRWPNFGVCERGGLQMKAKTASHGPEHQESHFSLSSGARQPVPPEERWVPHLPGPSRGPIATRLRCPGMELKVLGKVQVLSSSEHLA